MKELVAIVKTNLISNRSIILGEEKTKKRIISMILIFMFSVVTMEYGLIKTFNLLNISNAEALIFNSIINLEFIVIIVLVLSQVINTFYLASDWKEMMVYPIKAGDLLVSKCIRCYFIGIVVTIYASIFLFTYGILTKEGIYYYLTVVLFQVIIAAIPIIYITLITITLFWVISIIKNTKSKHKNNKWLIAIDLVVIILTYILLKPALNYGISYLLVNTFFNKGLNSLVFSQVIIVMAIIIIGFLGLYFIGGNVYLKVMKSGIFDSKDYKKIETETGNYEFKLRNTVMSNVVREAKIIIGTPVLRTNCIMVSAVISAIALVLLILFREQVISLRSNYGIKSFLVISCFLLLAMFSFTSITSYSREGRHLNHLKIYPVSSKKILLSKICIGVLTNMLSFIITTVLIVLISSDFIDFILLEVILIAYMIGFPIILISKDLGSMELKWVDIKDLFQVHVFKILIPIYILTIIPGIYPVASTLLDIQAIKYLDIGIAIFTLGIYALFSLKKISIKIN